MALSPNGLRSAVALIVFSGLLMLSGQLAVFIVPLPLAVEVTRGRFKHAGGLFASVIVAGFVGEAGVPSLSVAAILGAAIGLGIRRRTSYTRLVISVTALTVALSGLVTLAAWDETVEEVNSTYEELGLRIEGAQEEGLNDQALANLHAQQWLLGHWVDIYLGMSFAGMLILTCLMVGGTTKWLSVRDGAKPFAVFSSFRPPDWLVWVVIATVAVWFLDYRSPSPALRFAGWNAGFALASVYWISGLAILMHSVAVLRPNVVLMIGLVFALFFLGLASLLLFVGLFDTWGEFRLRLDRYLMERDGPEDSPDDMA